MLPYRNHSGDVNHTNAGHSTIFTPHFRKLLHYRKIPNNEILILDIFNFSYK